MKTILTIALLAGLAFAVPAPVMAQQQDTACDGDNDIIGGHGDLPNHQSSLSSTTAGGTTCTEENDES